MTRVSNEALFEWANNPPEYKIVGFATSEQELSEIRDWVIGERLWQLYQMASEEIASRQGAEFTPEIGQTVESDFDFSALPLKCTLNKRECHILAGDLWSGFTNDWYWAQPAAVRYWNDAAQVGVALGGYGMLSSKYTDMPYVDYVSRDGLVTKSAEEMFQDALAVSEEYSHLGYNSPLLMDGVHKVDYASLDLDVIERDLDGAIQKFGYLHFHPERFWRKIIRAKRERDQTKGFQSYADVVREVAEGVYIAPYLDETVKHSGRFLSRDDIVAVAIEQGLDHVNGSTLFAEIIYVLDTQGLLRETYSDGWRRTKRLGAIFFEKEMLLEARFALESGNAHKRTTLLNAVIKKHLGDNVGPVDERIDEAYDYLVFDD